MRPYLYLYTSYSDYFLTHPDVPNTNSTEEPTLMFKDISIEIPNIRLKSYCSTHYYSSNSQFHSGFLTATQRMRSHGFDLRIENDLWFFHTGSSSPRGLKDVIVAFGGLLRMVRGWGEGFTGKAIVGSDLAAPLASTAQEIASFVVVDSTLV